MQCFTASCCQKCFPSMACLSRWCRMRQTLSSLPKDAVYLVLMSRLIFQALHYSFTSLLFTLYTIKYSLITLNGCARALLSPGSEFQLFPIVEPGCFHTWGLLCTILLSHISCLWWIACVSTFSSSWDLANPELSKRKALCFLYLEPLRCLAHTWWFSATVMCLHLRVHPRILIPG